MLLLPVHSIVYLHSFFYHSFKEFMIFQLSDEYGMLIRNKIVQYDCGQDCQILAITALDARTSESSPSDDWL